MGVEEGGGCWIRFGGWGLGIWVVTWFSLDTGNDLATLPWFFRFKSPASQHRSEGLIGTFCTGR